MQKATSLNYVIDSKTVARLLGSENFNTPDSAILEIVKNSYDAGASRVTIAFYDDSIIIQDDGEGMSYDDLTKKWMRIGESDKTKCIERNGRILSGSMGVGRFALAKLGQSVFLESVKNGSLPVAWYTDWETTNARENIECDFSQGTRIKIGVLRDNWTDKRIDDLYNFLSLSYKSQIMSIFICKGASKREVQPYFQKELYPSASLSRIFISYNAEKTAMEVHIRSQEFSHFAEEALKRDLSSAELFLSCEELVEADDVELAKKLGNFDATFFFYVSHKSSNPGVVDMRIYNENTKEWNDKYGVALYRNSFAISSFEGRRDWLEFGKRSRKSPAAESHPSGAWRVRENNISGYVNIDRNKNAAIKELSNRQGIEDNDSYRLFKDLILAGLKEFETWRQSVIRKFVVSRNKAIEKDDLNDLTNYKKVSALSYEDAVVVAKRIKTYREETQAKIGGLLDDISNMQYDIRMLQATSTSSLKAYSMAHNLLESRNDVNYYFRKGIESLRELNIWDTLDDQQKSMFEQARDGSKTIVNIADAMLNQIEKDRFNPRKINIEELLRSICDIWKRDYLFLEFYLSNDLPETTYASEDIFYTIFNNLILNSIQQADEGNESIDSLRISISAKFKDGLIHFAYCDNGKGLPKKYINRPFLILEPLESSRKDGHGLGMWIVNSSIRMTGGQVVNIDGHNGFTFEFTIGEKLWK